MKHLIGMTDFVLDQGKKPNTSDFRERFVVNVINYANFLKQPLKLWMFIPCDEDGNVLEKSCEVFDDKCRYCACREYQKAKERCLFEGFEIYDEETLRFKDIFIEYSDFFKIDVEGLEYYCSSTKLQLTPTALKQIGL